MPLDSFLPRQCSCTICTFRLSRQSTSSNHRIYPMKLHFTSNVPLDLLSPCTKRTSVSEVRLAMHALFQRLQRYGATANIALVNLTDPFSAMLDLFRIKLSPFASFNFFVAATYVYTAHSKKFCTTQNHLNFSAN